MGKPPLKRAAKHCTPGIHTTWEWKQWPSYLRRMLTTAINIDKSGSSSINMNPHTRTVRLWRKTKSLKGASIANDLQGNVVNPRKRKRSCKSLVNIPREFWESIPHSLNKNRRLWKWSITGWQTSWKLKTIKQQKNNNSYTRTSVKELGGEMDVTEKTN